MRRTIGVLLVVLLVTGSVAWSQQTPPPVDKSQVVLTWDQFVKITGYDPAKGGPRTLSIPWSEVESLLGVKVDRVGKETTVDLPWSEFKALLEWSMKQKEKPGEKPPADYIVTSSEYAGTLTDEKGDFELKLKIDVLQQKGWKRIPVLPISVAVVPGCTAVSGPRSIVTLSIETVPTSGWRCPSTSTSALLVRSRRTPSP